MHDLKIHPRYLREVSSGRKTFELRRDDRGFAVGDTFILRGWDGKAYTGEAFSARISYILRDCPQHGLMEGYCIFSWGPDLSGARHMPRGRSPRRRGALASPPTPYREEAHI
ncbi:MAG: DUF3850 domain-containing protein [Lachnospiraceae bacterium]|nr:DUF3850 domain-containing protein [Lachnospiraceae bacterium]